MLVAALLGGCSSVRLAYSNASQLAWWWLDGHLDFSIEQTPAAKEAIDRYFEWHRRTQLPAYVGLLAQAQVAALAPTTPTAACRWQDELRDAIEPALQQALLQGAEMVPGLAEPQFRHLEKRYARDNQEMRDDFLQPDLAERLAESVQRATDRAERLYGRLDEPQRRVIREGVTVSPFNPELWLAEKQRRQRDAVQTLRRLVAERADAEQRLAGLKALALRTERPPDPEYRAYQLRLRSYNCALAAQLHNATTAVQRQRARDTLKGWENDLRAMMAAP